VQETWLTAVRRIRDFDSGRGSFAGWLRGIAANLLHKQFARAGKTFVPLDGQEAAPPAADTDRAERVAWALARLPARQEAVLRAKYLDRQSVQHIADEWQTTAKAVESLLARARQAFREIYCDPARAGEPSDEEPS
jgi:RNA polymerase sigma-70 factor (ECF subfamily)